MNFTEAPIFEYWQDYRNIIIGLGILVGAIQCFFGYRIFKFILGLIGFLVGGAIAGAIGFSMSQNEIVVLLVGIVGGFIGAALMIALYFIGIFLIGALLGGVIGFVLYASVGNSPEAAVVLILAVVVGVIALIFQKFMIIVSTGFGGAWGVVFGMAYFITDAIDLTNLEQMFRATGIQLYAIVLCWLALGIVGVIVQYKFALTGKEET